MIKCIAVLGAGTMGRNIALFFAGKGIEVNLYDLNSSALRSAAEEINSPAGDPSCGQVHKEAIPAASLAAAVSNADLIIETISENPAVKRELYTAITSLLKDDRVIVVSNTSTIPLSVLSSGYPFANRMLIAHFFNPAHLIPLVEVVKLDATTPGVVEELVAFLHVCGKTPVLLNRDIAGFIANRLQAAVLREAIYLVEQRVADVHAIDCVVKQSIGLRWALSGPFETMDYGGLDIWEKVLSNLLPLLSNATAVPDIITEKVNQNHFGAKTGSGFYQYDQSSVTSTAKRREAQLTDVLKMTGH
jgi:3-hydroxybutyryl-CoA dehydrogenase